MRLGIDPKVDYAFKRLFGSEKNHAILISLLHAVLQLPPNRQIVQIEILNPFSIKEALDDKLSIVDILAVDQRGRQYFIEMQMLAPWHFPKRILYYWAQRHKDQILEGEEYATLKPTIGICFLNSILFDASDYHLQFRLIAEKQKIVFSEDIEIHVLELPKFVLTENELTTPLDRWLFFLRHADNLDPEHLPPLLDSPEIHLATEDLRVLTQDQQERLLYESRFKKLHDDNYLANYGNIMRREGREEGREEGLLIGRITLCQKLLQLPSPAKVELERMGPTELKNLTDQLEQELFKKLGRAQS